MNQQKLGLELAELRKAKGLTQEALVAKCNINVRTLQRIEAGEVIPRSYTLQTILAVLEVDYSDFVGRLYSKQNIKDKLDTIGNVKRFTYISLIGKWSFAIYIPLLLVFSFLIKLALPWYFYIIPVVLIFFINTGELELETNL